jgi:hypothetical protein
VSSSPAAQTRSRRSTCAMAQGAGPSTSEASTPIPAPG